MSHDSPAYPERGARTDARPGGVIAYVPLLDDVSPNNFCPWYYFFRSFIHVSGVITRMALDARSITSAS